MEMMDESNFETIEGLKHEGNFTSALALIESALTAPMDADSRRRYLINLIVCAANLKLEERGASAIAELETLSPSPVWDISKHLVIASFHTQFDRYDSALNALKKNLEINLLMSPEYTTERYETIAEIGIALARLGRPHEAIAALRNAEEINPNGDYLAFIKIELSACLKAIGKLDEAYAEAESITRLGARDIADFALYRMANIRLQQGRCAEALQLYGELRAKLPTKFVPTKDVEKGVVEALKGSAPNVLWRQ